MPPSTGAADLGLHILQSRLLASMAPKELKGDMNLTLTLTLALALALTLTLTLIEFLQGVLVF